MTAAELKDQAWWERYFTVGGDWERNGGRAQTRIFAEHFVRRSGLPRDRAFTLLDAGCALGDALAVFARAFPKARLYGIDFSGTAIARAGAELGPTVTLHRGDLDAIEGRYDAVYCSNTLEHFADFDARARRLLQHADRLFVMVPHDERRDGRRLRPDRTEHHQHTFERDSFDFLVREGLARSVTTRVFACPGAWGWSPVQHAAQFARNIGRALRGRPRVAPPRQILYAIESAALR
ncbi:MAG: class I SAM-dependent methyltransferase [Burkholderiales bacterium]|nr:methyltransferase domain-containing protein [Burkholderiales bacterium]MDE1925920.1 class I SAM-dependent methyltransferase [Burkholderiales bacterium]MDE2157437.1 class I SAM-dependent methyltransferase [Burkholderiales bacterium]